MNEKERLSCKIAKILQDFWFEHSEGIKSKKLEYGHIAVRKAHRSIKKLIKEEAKKI